MTKVHEILMVAKQIKTKRRISRDLLYNSLQHCSTGISNKWHCSWYYCFSRLDNCIVGYIFSSNTCSKTKYLQPDSIYHILY